MPLNNPIAASAPNVEYLGNQAGGNYTRFDPATGFMQAAGSARGYRDYNFAGASLGAAASAPDLGAIGAGTIQYRLFDGNNTLEQLYGSVEMDHDWAEGTIISPHIHWMPTTADSGNVKWNLTVQYWDSETPTAVAEQTVSIVSAASGAANRGIIAVFPNIDLVGYHIGTQFSFRLWRDPSDNADTYSHDAAVATLGLHVIIDSIGSRQISTK